MKPKLGARIAERELSLVVGKGMERKVYVRFGRPQQFSDGGFYCVYEITGLFERSLSHYAAGEDSVQALYLAMQLAMTRLSCSDAYRKGNLTWAGSTDLGLPINEDFADSLKEDE